MFDLLIFKVCCDVKIYLFFFGVLFLSRILAQFRGLTCSGPLVVMIFVEIMFLSVFLNYEFDEIDVHYIISAHYVGFMNFFLDYKCYNVCAFF